MPRKSYESACRSFCEIHGIKIVVNDKTIITQQPLRVGWDSLRYQAYSSQGYFNLPVIQGSNKKEPLTGCCAARWSLLWKRLQTYKPE